MISLLLALFACAAPSPSAEPGAAVGKVDPPPLTRTLTVPGWGDLPVRHPADLERTAGVVIAIDAPIDGIRPDAVVIELASGPWRRRVEANAAHCWYPAGELEGLAQQVEKAVGLREYLHPVLFGKGWGAAVAYAALAQAPSTTFSRVVAEDLSPRLELARPLCSGSGWRAATPLPARIHLPTTASGAPLLLLDHPADAGFAAALGAGAAPGNITDAFEARTAPQTSTEPVPADVAARLDTLGLPLTVLWPQDAHRVFLFASGDGGWAEIDQGVSAELKKDGIAVIGFSTLRYFWSAKTPDQLAADLGRVIDALPGSLPVGAGGYSFGAEVIPVVLALHPELRVDRVAVIGPSRHAQFEVSPLDWVRSSSATTSWSMAEAFAGLHRPLLCLEAADGEESGCPEGPSTRRLPGGHHFNGDYASLGAAFVAFLDG